MAESEPSPFLHFNLGSEFLAAGDADAALVELERAWNLILERRRTTGVVTSSRPSLIPAARQGVLSACGRARTEALARADDRASSGSRGFTVDLVYEQATRGDRASSPARRPVIALLRRRCIEMGDAAAGEYTATVGCGTYLPRIALAELHLRRGESETQALSSFSDWCIRPTTPGFFGVVLPYASARLRTGTDPEVVTAEVERRVERTSPTVRFMLGTALYEPGAACQTAERQFRARARQPAAHRLKQARARRARRGRCCHHEPLPRRPQPRRRRLRTTIRSPRSRFAASCSAASSAAISMAPAPHRTRATKPLACRPHSSIWPNCSAAGWHRAAERRPGRAAQLRIPAVPPRRCSETMLEALLPACRGLQERSSCSGRTARPNPSCSAARAARVARPASTFATRVSRPRPPSSGWQSATSAAPDARALIGLGRVSRSPTGWHRGRRRKRSPTEALALEPGQPVADGLRS